MTDPTVKELEHDLMMLHDRYHSLAKALGLKGVGWFDDVLEGPSEVLQHAKDIAEKAWMYDQLNK